MQALLQPIVDQFNALLQPLYDALEQLRFFAALIFNVITALCFAQTFENRATALSRFVYLLVLWFLLPVSLSLLDSFYSLLGFTSRENFSAWLWLVKPSLLALLCCAYIGASLLAWDRRNVFDMVLFVSATLLIGYRLYSHFLS